MLALLVALVVLMPVSYRAGTDTSHSHTIFQGLIDMVIGQPHHHASTHSHAPVSSDAEHRDTQTAHDATRRTDQDQHPSEGPEAGTTSPDMPALLGLSMPIDGTASIHALGALLAAILGGSAIRSIWGTVRTASGRTPTLEPPPPRRA